VIHGWLWFILYVSCMHAERHYVSGGNFKKVLMANFYLPVKISPGKSYKFYKPRCDVARRKSAWNIVLGPVIIWIPLMLITKCSLMLFVMYFARNRSAVYPHLNVAVRKCNVRLNVGFRRDCMFSISKTRFTSAKIDALWLRSGTFCRFQYVPPAVIGKERMPVIGELNLNRYTLSKSIDILFVSVIILAPCWTRNSIAFVESGTFAESTQLRELWLNDNRILTVENGAFPPSVQQLWMSRNKFFTFTVSLHVNAFMLMDNCDFCKKDVFRPEARL